MSKNSTPKRKIMNRDKRLLSAKSWVDNYEGNKIVKAYAKWFGVDIICAIKELRVLNIKISKQCNSPLENTTKLRNKMCNYVNEKERKRVQAI